MKPNSCLFRAVKKVIANQFGISDLESDVFDNYNNGDGVPTGIVVTVINIALQKYGIDVDSVYGKISDPENFDRPDLIKSPQFVKAPCIGHVKDHVEGILPGEFFTADMAITLKRSSAITG